MSTTDPRLAALAALGLGKQAASAVATASAKAVSAPNARDTSAEPAPKTPTAAPPPAPAASVNPAIDAIIGNVVTLVKRFGPNVPPALLTNFAAQANLSTQDLLGLAQARINGGAAPSAPVSTPAPVTGPDTEPPGDEETLFQTEEEEAAEEMDENEANEQAFQAAVGAAAETDPEAVQAALEPLLRPADNTPRVLWTAIPGRAKTLAMVIEKMDWTNPVAEVALRGAFEKASGEPVHGRTWGAMVEDLRNVGIILTPTSATKDWSKRSFMVSPFAIIRGQTTAPTPLATSVETPTKAPVEEVVSKVVVPRDSGDGSGEGAPSPAEAPAASQVSTHTQAKPLEAATQATVYVGCRPEWTLMPSFEEVLAGLDLFKAVEAQLGVPHWRMGKYDDSKRAVRAHLAVAIRDNGIASIFGGHSAVYLDPDGYLTVDLLDLLRTNGYHNIVSRG